jgi:predicted ATPase/Tfp pilus assembly protein PilF
MGRVGTVRLSAEGIAALKRRFKESRCTSVDFFCKRAGVSKSAYYRLLDRTLWLEMDTVQDNLIAFGVPSPKDDKYVEYKHTIAPPSSNIPLQITSFVGRAIEIAEVRELLQHNRLLTLAGAGGCGKTRLMTQVAEEVANQYPDGIRLVQLASMEDPDLVPHTVAYQLELREEPGQSIAQTLVAALKSKHLLLILDNCEHLISACAALVDTLLKACPHLTVLTTSREVLNVPGEYAYPVPTLEISTPESLHLSEAGQLFIDRAGMINREFCVTDHNVGVIAQICRRLDGIPLAIELAAARVRTLSIEEIHTRLDNCFLLLTGGSRTAMPRHQTLRSLIDWSYDLLTASEKRLFGRLSLFAGGWTLAAAEAIGTGESVAGGEVLDLLATLVEKSMVIYEHVEGAGRYRMLETIRQYATEKRLVWSDEADLRGRYCNYFLAFVEDTQPLLGTSAEWHKHLKIEKSNLDATLAWCADELDSMPQALRLIRILQPFWVSLGLASEYRERCEPIVNRAGNSPELPWALLAVGRFAYVQSDFLTARRRWQKGVETCELNLDPVCKANLLCALGNIDYIQGDHAQAQMRYEEAMALITGLEQEWLESELLHDLGIIAYERGDYERAEDYYKQSLKRKRRGDNKHRLAFLLHDLGNMAKDRGDYEEAQRMHQEALTIYQTTHSDPGRAMSLNDLGVLALRKSDFHQARLYFQESLEIHSRHQAPGGIATVQCNIGILCLREKNFPDAQTFLRASLAQLVAIQNIGSLCRTLGWLACAEAASGRMQNCIRILSKQQRLHQTHMIVPLQAERTEQAEWTSLAKNAVSLEEYNAAMLAGDSISLDDWLCAAN